MVFTCRGIVIGIEDRDLAVLIDSNGEKVTKTIAVARGEGTSHFRSSRELVS